MHYYKNNISTIKYKKILETLMVVSEKRKAAAVKRLEYSLPQQFLFSDVFIQFFITTGCYCRASQNN